jgi:hypothetical protein
LYKQLGYEKYQPELEIPEKWTDEITEKHYQDWLTKRYYNLSNIIAFLNNGLTADQRIALPAKKEFDAIRGIRIADTFTNE